MARTDGYPLTDVVADGARSIYRRPMMRLEDRIEHRIGDYSEQSHRNGRRFEADAGRTGLRTGGTNNRPVARRSRGRNATQGRALGNIQRQAHARHLLDTNIVSAGSWRRIYSTQTSFRPSSESCTHDVLAGRPSYVGHRCHPRPLQRAPTLGGSRRNEVDDPPGGPDAPAAPCTGQRRLSVGSMDAQERKRLISMPFSGRSILRMNRPRRRNRAVSEYPRT